MNPAARKEDHVARPIEVKARAPSAPKFGRTPQQLREIIWAERTRKPFLVWHTATGDQCVLILGLDMSRLTIGRDPEADVPITWDREASRTHALLERIGHGWTLVDDGLSRNGSFVNDMRVHGRRRLSEYDRLRFGATEVTYRDPKGIAADSTASISGTPALRRLSPMQRRVLVALCRPVHESSSAVPATNRQIAAEVFLSVDAVKAHLRVLFDRYELGDLPQNEKRARLVTEVLGSGVLSPREFEL